GAEQRRRAELDALVEIGLVHLADRALRPRRASRLHLCPHPLVGPVADALLAVDAHQLLADDGLARRTARSREREQVLHAPATDTVDASGTGARHHLALSRQCRSGDLPAVTDRTHAH